MTKLKQQTITLIITLCFLSIFCGPKQDKVERIVEEGVEVVLNHLEPYKLKGEPTNLVLIETLKIDLERTDLAEIGLTDSYGFDVDSKGNIYIMSDGRNKPYVYKFNKDGEFITSFLKKGQGPGEVQFIVQGGIDNNDNLVISDQMSRSAYIFSNEGNLIERTKNPSEVFFMYPLENGNFLAFQQPRGEVKPSDDYYLLSYSLYSPELEEVKVLDIYKLMSRMNRGSNALNPNPLFLFEKSKKYIFIGNENRGFEIQKFDLVGNLLLKIRKEYTPVPVPEDIKKKTRERLGKTGRKFFINDYWPPYYSFFPDDEGWLFVMTYEEGTNPGEYIFDIFNPDGAFISRKSMNIFAWGRVEISATAKNKHLYCLREKENGFKELVVFKMMWE